MLLKLNLFPYWLFSSVCAIEVDSSIQKNRKKKSQVCMTHFQVQNHAYRRKTLLSNFFFLFSCFCVSSKFNCTSNACPLTDLESLPNILQRHYAVLRNLDKSLQGTPLLTFSVECYYHLFMYFYRFFLFVHHTLNTISFEFHL